MLMPRPSVPMLPKPIEIQEDAKRKGSCDSIESLQSNPAQFSDDDYDLVAGNTRLSGLVKYGYDPKLWVVDISDIFQK